MSNNLASPKDIDFPENLTGEIVVKDEKNTTIYDFKDGKLQSVEIKFGRSMHSYLYPMDILTDNNGKLLDMKRLMSADEIFRIIHKHKSDVFDKLINESMVLEYDKSGE